MLFDPCAFVSVNVFSALSLYWCSGDGEAPGCALWCAGRMNPGATAVPAPTSLQPGFAEGFKGLASTAEAPKCL